MKQTTKELAQQLFETKKDFSKRIESGRKAKNLCWDLMRLFQINGSIGGWRLGRRHVRYEHENLFFCFNYDCGTKQALIAFKANNDGKSLQTIQQGKELEAKITKLIPDFIDKLFEKVGDITEKEAKDIKVICKLFNPTGAGTWYLYDREDKEVYWCYANLGDIQFAELGTVSITELAELKGMLGLGIERDKFFEPNSMTLQEVMDKIQTGGHV